MKKFLLSLLALVALAAHAETTTTYDGTLTVAADLGFFQTQLYSGESSLYVITQDDGKYTISLKNFSIEMYGVMLNLGNINVTDIDATEDDGTITLSTEQMLTIEDGDDDSIEWIGKDEFGEINVALTATITDGTISATIAIPVGMDIIVTFEGTAAEEDGIQSITTTSTAVNAQPYTLSGTKATANTKGIIIQDGMKVIKK